jgi:hypothetical protein
MATTPNYGWVTPAPTDFVTDLPADFETFADAVDADLAGLLGGTTGQALVKDSNADHDFSWGTIAAPAENWTLLNTGGTTLTGAQTITISGISGKNQIMILVTNASSVNASAYIGVRINADTASNYNWYGQKLEFATTYSSGNFGGTVLTDTYIPLGRIGTSASDVLYGGCIIMGCNSSGVKAFHSTGGGRGTSSESFNLQGFYSGSSTVSSVSIHSSTGNLDGGGTVFVYATA